MAHRSFSRSVAVGGVLVAGIVAACTDDPAGPVPRRGPQLGVLAPGSGDAGCGAFDVTLGGSRPTVTPLDSGRAACGPLVLLVDTGATYDSAAGVVRLPVGFANTGTVAVTSPAYVQSWADSLQLVLPASWPADTSGGARPLGFASPDSVGDTTAAPRPVFWWYDRSLVAPDTASQQLEPNGRSQTRLIDVRVQPGVQQFRVVLHAHAQGVAPAVPGAAPDSVPDAVLGVARADNNLLSEDDPNISGPAPRDIVLITFQRAASAAERQAAVAAVNGVVLGGFPVGYGIYYVRIPSDGTSGPLSRAIATLAARPAVRQAMPDYVNILDATYLKPRDGAAFRQWRTNPARADLENWGPEAVGAPAAWGCSTGDTTTQIGVVDRWFRRDPDLAPNVDPSYAPWSSPTYAHGTYVASIIGAVGNNGTGMTGMMWQAKLRLFDYQNKNFKIASITGSEALGAVDAAAKSGVAVINLSSGLPWRSGYQPHTPADSSKVRDIANVRFDVLDLAGQVPLNVKPLLVVAAGNNPGLDAYWSAYPAVAQRLPNQVVVVAASDSTGQLAAFSQRNTAGGPQLVDVIAPGAGVSMLDGSGNIRADSGTSFAAPHVTGAAGLLKAFDPRLTAADLKNYLLIGARRSNKTIGGLPLLNAYHALRAASERPDAPLCGKPVYRDTVGTYFTRSDSGWQVQSAPLLTDASPFKYPLHGGKQLLFASGAAYGWQPASGTWASAGTVVDTLGNATARSKLGQSHDGDTTATVQKRSGTNPRYDEDWDVFLNGTLLTTIPASTAPKVNTGHRVTVCTQWPTSGTETLNCLDSFNIDTIISSTAAVSYASGRGDQGQVVVAIATAKTVTSAGPKYASGVYWWRDTRLEGGNTWASTMPLGTYYFYIDVKSRAIVRRDFIRSQAHTEIGFSEDGNDFVTRRVTRNMNTNWARGTASTTRTLSCGTDYNRVGAGTAALVRVVILPTQQNVTTCYPEATFAP